MAVVDLAVHDTARFASPYGLDSLFRHASAKFLITYVLFGKRQARRRVHEHGQRGHKDGFPR